MWFGKGKCEAAIAQSTQPGVECPRDVGSTRTDAYSAKVESVMDHSTQSAALNLPGLPPRHRRRLSCEMCSKYENIHNSHPTSIFIPTSTTAQAFRITSLSEFKLPQRVAHPSLRVRVHAFRGRGVGRSNTRSLVPKDLVDDAASLPSRVYLH